MTNKTKLIPFDWDKYQQGSEVICRSEDYRVISLQLLEMERFKDDQYMKECLLLVFMKNGFFDYKLINLNGLFSFETKMDFDIFLKEEIEEKTFYINIYPHPYEESARAYSTVEKAIYSQASGCLGHIKVTYTDEDLIK